MNTASKKITGENWEDQGLSVILYTDTFKTHLTHSGVDVIDLLNGDDPNQDSFPRIHGSGKPMDTITWEEPSAQSLVHRIENLVLNLDSRLYPWRTLVKYDKSWMTNIVLLYMISYLLTSLIQESEGDIHVEAREVLTKVRFIWSKTISHLLGDDSPLNFEDQADVVMMASKELAETIRISSGADCSNQCHIQLI